MNIIITELWAQRTVKVKVRGSNGTVDKLVVVWMPWLCRGLLNILARYKTSYRAKIVGKNSINR